MHPIFHTSVYNISQDSNYTRQLSTKLEFRNIKLSNLLKNKNPEEKDHSFVHILELKQTPTNETIIRNNSLPTHVQASRTIT
jgi:hypothetical protein